jgi:hypothetical protein
MRLTLRSRPSIPRAIHCGEADSSATSSRRPWRSRHSGALAAAGPPLLARPEVVHVGELDVGHRRPAGDGDRDRDVGQAALRVQRAVDRVDDHADALRAEVHDAALLRDRAEPQPVGVEALELREDDVLDLAVDHERAVTASAALARLDHALAARRVLAQDTPQAADGAAAGAQPVGLQDGRLRGHPSHATGGETVRRRP